MGSKIRLTSRTPIQRDSIVDGPGLRTVIWTQGCKHSCKGCHNPETWDFNSGEWHDVIDIAKKVVDYSFHKGITFSGGDPFFQAYECSVIAKKAHEYGLNVWCYTGYKYEDLIELSKSDNNIYLFLNEIDFLVDGKFDINLKTYDLLFRGSSNQRIIDVNKSLNSGKTVECFDYDKNVGFNKSNIRETVFI